MRGNSVGLDSEDIERPANPFLLKPHDSCRMEDERVKGTAEDLFHDRPLRFVEGDAENRRQGA